MSDDLRDGELRAALDSAIGRLDEPMAFLRELLQNALDARSPEIEIHFDFEDDAEGGEGEAGVTVVHVDDYGEGMDRELIDTRLTRLFASAGGADLSGIGRFGIGFVSVFAIAPDAVCVDTSRGGESWRVLFERDLSFHCLPRQETVEGTRVRIYKQHTRVEHDAFVERARETVEFWCKHSTAEIRFAGELVNRPLELDTVCHVSHADRGVELVVGYPSDGRSFAGFYNQGLTLLETDSGYWDGVAFKINARALEHTLDRKGVRRTDAYEQVLAVVERIVDRELPARLFERIEAALSADEPSPALDTLYRLAGWVIAQRRPRWPRGTDGRIVLRSVHGKRISLGELREAAAKRRVFVDTADSPLSVAMEDEGVLVARAAPGEAVFEALGEWLGAEPQRAASCYCKPTPAQNAEEARAWAPLRLSLGQLLEAAGAPPARLELAHLDPTGAAGAQRVAVAQRVFGELSELDQALPTEVAVFADGRVLVVNADHPLVARLVALASGAPARAAAILMGLIFHEEPAARGRLVAAVVAAAGLRERRLERAAAGAP